MSFWCNWVAVYWEIAAHKAYDMISFYEYFMSLFGFLPRFLEWEFLSDLTITFLMTWLNSSYILLFLPIFLLILGHNNNNNSCISR